MREETLKQTARDYDMELYDVERIAKVYPESELYERLEEHLKERRDK